MTRYGTMTRTITTASHSSTWEGADPFEASEPEGIHEQSFIERALVGHVIGHDYEIKRLLARGGMGTIFLARQRTLDRDVVLKIVDGSARISRSFERFEREARALSQIRHENVVTIYDYGVQEDLHYIAMEYIDGETLQDHINNQGPMSYECFELIADQILSALSAIHARGLIHRDLKPSNVMVSPTPEGCWRATLLDFGLVKCIDGDEELTGENAVLGSVSYMAPEVIMGWHVVDQRADVYSVSVLFYSMLTGRRPFRKNTDLATLQAHLYEAHIPLAEALPEGHDVPAGVIEVIEKGLSKAPVARYADAAMMRLDMAQSSGIFELLGSQDETVELYTSVPCSVSEPPRPPAAAVSSTSRRDRTPRRAVFAAGLAGLAIVLLSLGMIMRDAQPVSADTSLSQSDSLLAASSLSTSEAPGEAYFFGPLAQPDEPYMSLDQEVDHAIGQARIEAMELMQGDDYQGAIARLQDALDTHGEDKELRSLIDLAREFSQYHRLENVEPESAPTLKAAPAHKKVAAKPRALKSDVVAETPRPISLTPYGKVVVRSEPAGLSVHINGESMGTTPLVTEIPSGLTHVEVFDGAQRVEARRFVLGDKEEERIVVGTPANDARRSPKASNSLLPLRPEPSVRSL